MERGIITTRLAHVRHQVLCVAAAVAVLVTATACGGLASPKKSVEVRITSPASNAALNAGVSAIIQAEVTGDAITRVDVLIDGQQYAILTTDDKNKGMSNFPVQVPWTPPSGGIHIIQLAVYGPDGKVLIKSEPAIFNVQGATAQDAASAAAGATAAAVPAAMPAETAVVAEPTAALTLAPAATNAAAPTVAATPVPVETVNAATPTVASVVIVVTQVITVTVTSASPVVAAATAPATTAALSADSPSLTITSDSANVRAGPDTTYEVLGQLQNGAIAAVRGKSSDGAWWQITFASAPSGLGWVRGDLAQVNNAAASVPVVTVAPLPTQQPSATLPPGATAVPQSTAAATGAVTSSEPECNANTPGWIGADPRYPFCVAKVLAWFDNQDGAHRYESSHDMEVSLSWDIWGVDGIWMIFDQDNSGYCDFTKQAVKTVNEKVPNAGTYTFNVKDYPGGATMRVYLRVKRKDGQVVEYGDKRLCIY